MRNAVRQILLGERIIPPPIVAMTSGTTPSPYVVSASSVFSADYLPFYAFDGSTFDGGSIQTSWASSNLNIYPQWIAINYGARYTFEKVELTNRGGAGSSQHPTHFSLQTSDDGSIFTTIATYSGQVFASQETKIFTFNRVLSQYLRINITAAQSGIVALAEIKWS